MLATILALIPAWLKWAAAGLAGACLLAGGSYIVGKHEGRQQAAVEAVAAANQAYRDRNDENAEVEALDPVALCVELGGLHDDCAAELRRLGENPGQAGDSGLSGGQ